MIEIQAETLNTVYFFAKHYAAEIALGKVTSRSSTTSRCCMRAAYSFGKGEVERRLPMLRLGLRNEERKGAAPRALKRLSWGDQHVCDVIRLFKGNLGVGHPIIVSLSMC